MIETNAGNGAILKLPASLDLAAAHDLLAALKEKTADAKPVWLDASDVEAVALPCIQVIVAAINLRDAGSVATVDGDDSSTPAPLIMRTNSPRTTATAATRSARR